MTALSNADLLRRVRARIEKPENWTQGEFWRDEAGQRVPDDSPDKAVCYCLAGAVLLDGDYGDVEALAETLGFGIGVDGACALYNWNDRETRTHADVLARLDAAIKEVGT